MTEDLPGAAEEWSPAHYPEAIAVSEAQWCLWTLRICAHRLDRRDVDMWPPDPRQIDARQFAIALRQVDYAAEMLLKQALPKSAGPTRLALEKARQRFLAAVPGAIAARDILIHFSDYAVGAGNRQREQRRREGAASAARHHWGGGYDPATGDFAQGPNRINVKSALDEAEHLFDAIYMAARAIDRAER